MYKRNFLKTNRTRIQDKYIVKHLKGFKEYPDSKDIIIPHLKDVINTLGYDLNSEFIYAVDKGEKYEWKTTINKKFIKNMWSYIYKKPEMFYEHYLFEDHILQHMFPLELKNKSLKGDIHYINHDMCGCNIKDISDILILDIDCHRNNSLDVSNEYNALYHYFKKQFLYSEISSEGSYHVFIKLDKQYTLYEKRQFFIKIKQELNLYNTDIPTKLRFPFSYHYEPYKHDGYFEIYPVMDATKEIIINYKEQKGFNLQLKEKIEIPKQTYKPSKIYGRQFKSSLEHITPEQYLQSTDIIISQNNRWLPMLEICRISKFNNWSNEDTLQIIRQLDTGSNDLKKWNDSTLLKNIQSIKDNSLTYFQEHISHRPEKFISNIKHIPKQILTIIENKKLLNHIIEKSSYKLTNINKHKFSICFKEFIGYMFYNTINKKTSDKTKYLIGTQLSEQYCIMLKQHYGHLFKAFNPHEIIKCILQHSNLFKQYKHNYRGWLYNPDNPEFNFCKQYDLSNNNKHYLLDNSNILCYLLLNIIQSTCFKVIKQLNISKFFSKIIQNIKEIFDINDEDMFPIPV
jgi:hypothetical protein